MFTVEIAKTKNVSILKDLIKENNVFQLTDVDAPDLEIWKVDFLPIGNIPSKNLLFDGFKLRSGKLLSDVVIPSGLDINYVHVVVHAPVTSE